MTDLYTLNGRVLTRHHHSRPTEAQQMRTKLDAHLRAGLSIKAFAFEHGYQANYIYKVANDIGFALVMLAPDEQQMLAEYRRGRRVA